MIEQSVEIGAIAKALLTAQAQLGGVVRDSKNPHFKSAYASLESVIQHAKPALQSAGVAFTQAPGAIVDGAIEITTMLMHGDTGQWLRSTVHVPLAKRDPQGVGSAITYGCRYALMATLGLPPVDDDAEAAMLRGSANDEPPPIKSSRHAEIEAELVRSAQKGTKVLRAAWESLSQADRAHFQAAKDRRFKPMADEADRSLAIEDAA